MTLNAFGMAACPDCGAVPDRERRLLTHADTCPVGRDADATSAADAAWFRTRPGARLRRRPLSWSEAVTLAALSTIPLPEGTRWHGHVLVRQVAPGVRVRSFAGVYARHNGTGVRA